MVSSNFFTTGLKNKHPIGGWLAVGISEASNSITRLKSLRIGMTFRRGSCMAEGPTLYRVTPDLTRNLEQGLGIYMIYIPRTQLGPLVSIGV